MAIYYLSGYDDVEVGRRRGGGGLFKKLNPFKKGGGIVAKVGLAPARGAFLALVSLNVMKLATKLAKAWKRNPDKVKNFWRKFGGDEGKLKNAIQKGSRQQLSGIGFAAESAIATATPIIVAAVKLFKELNVKDEPDASGLTAEQGAEQGKQTLIETGQTTDASELPEGSKMAVKVTKASDTEPTSTAKTTQSEEQPKTNITPLLLGGGALALLLLTKKNK